MALNIDGLSPDFVVGTIEGIQPGLWGNISSSILLPQVPLFLPKDRKIAVAGLTKLLTESPLMLQEPNIRTWPTTLVTLAKLSGEPQYLTNKASDDADTGFTMVDAEEQNAGYQAAYSRLAASEFEEPDPVGYITNPVTFIGEQFKALQGRVGQDKVRQLVNASQAPEVAPFIAQLGSQGYTI